MIHLAENFNLIYYNKDGIAQLLKQFGDAISDKQYKNRIPYDVYRKIRDSQIIFISLNCGDIIVTNDSTTLFRTSYEG